MKEVDVIIPVRDKDQDRLEKCVKSLRQTKLVKNIFIVDNSLKRPLKEIEAAEIIKVKYDGYWNKSWLMNIGLKKCTSKYVMTIDCDILLSEDILEDIEKVMNEKTFIFNKNVRRLEPFNYSEDYAEMITDSYPWEKTPIDAIYGQAFGGIQVMPRKWLLFLNGFDEDAGLLWGGMDNRTYEQATLTGLFLINLNSPMIHLEHGNKKGSSLDKKDKLFAFTCKALKRTYLNSKIHCGEIKNREKFGGKVPDNTIMEFITKNEIKKKQDYIDNEIEKFKILKIKKGQTVLNGQQFNIEIKDETEDIPSNN